MSLNNESIVVITGAASGIGRALAARLVRESISGVALADVNETELRETARMLEGKISKISSHVVDVGSLEQMREFAANVIERHGKATHLINNAGVSLFGTFEEVSIEDFEWLMNINFWGTVYGVKFFLPLLKKQPAAHIVNLSSVFGLVAPPGNAAYSASKFAVRGFTEALRHELDGTSVSVSCVHPGGVATNIAKDGKIGAETDAFVKEASVKFHTKASRTTAEQAAETIVKGIKRRSKRILVGSDARLIDAVQRAAPENYLRGMDWLSGGKISRLGKIKSGASK